MLPIEIKGVTKRFPAAAGGNGEITVLNGIDLTVDAGQSVAIIGKSGTGKSTLLQIAGGLDSPSEGTVLCCGTDFAALDDSGKSALRNKRIGFIFQANLLLDDFTALENVMVPAMISGTPKSRCAERAESLLSELGLSGRLSHYPGQLSGGEKQRVAICRALMNEPDILLADEPTGALDEENASEVENLLLELANRYRRSLLLVTHNIEFARRCNTVYMLKNHVLEPCGNTAEGF